MKNLLKVFAVAVTIVLAACSKDAAEPSVYTGDTQVTFTTTIPGATEGRAIADGSTVDKLYYAVYEHGQTQALITDEEDVVGKTATVNVTLVSGMKYDIVFWAQKEGAPYTFNTTDNRIDINWTNLVGNNEDRDAFIFVRKALEVNGSIQETITLKRPFAQLNIGISDFEAAKKAGFELAETKVSVDSYDQINFFGGEAYSKADGTGDYGMPAGTETPVTFACAAPMTGADETINIKGTDYKYVSMNYILPAMPTDAYDVDITFCTANEVKQYSVPTFAGVTFERNHRTNIMGSLLTDPGKFVIEIDEEFDDEDYNVDVPVSVAVTVPDNNTADVVLSTETVAITVPASEASDGDSYKMVVGNESTETDNATGETTVAFDLTMYKNGVKVSGGTIYEVALNVGAGKIIAEVQHNGTPLTKAETGADQTYKYDSATGVLTIYTASFSPFAVTYANYKDYVRTKNFFYGGYISVSTGRDLLPIVAIMPEITKYSVFDGDTRITDAVTFRFSDVKKETISENAYKVSVNLAIKDDKGNDLVLKPGMPSTINGKEYLHVYMNLIEVPAGYAISEVKVGGASLTAITSGNVAAGEYWIGADAKDLYFQSKTAGLIEVTLTK